MENDVQRIWWEKTVEYLFVKQYIPKDALFTPLDGIHELASDGILFSKVNWVLIEFKSTEHELPREKDKFKVYDECMDKLKSFSHHHVFIYGVPRNHKIILTACNYFDNTRICSIEEALEGGTDPIQFTKYLVNFLLCKKSKRKLKSTIDYSNVIGIHNGEVVASLSVNSFLETAWVELKREQKKSPSSDVKKIMDAIAVVMEKNYSPIVRFGSRDALS